jgi:hypothetical protein
MKFKDLDQRLLKLYNGDVWAFPDFKLIYSLYERIKGKEVQKPVFKKQKFKEMISGLQEYISNVPRYATDLDQVFPFQVGLHHSIFEQNIINFDFDFRPLLSDRITFEEYIQKYCLKDNSSGNQTDVANSTDQEFSTETSQNSTESENHAELITKDFGTNQTSENKEVPNWEDYKNHFLPTMKVQEVVDFFSVLKKPFKGKGKPFLTEEQFNDFIKRSFCGEVNTPKPKIFLPQRSKLAVEKLFFIYYDRCRSEVSYSKSKLEYLDLLKTAFDTLAFSNSDEKNFRINKSTYDWEIYR